MKSRYLFNATQGSVWITPSEYVLEARPGSLRLAKPSGAAYGLQLLVVLLAAFGYLGLGIFLVASPGYQASRLWENPVALWTGLTLFFGGFFVLLVSSEVLGRRYVLSRATRQSTSADAVTVRGIRPGRLIQRLLIQTADGRLLTLEVEALGRRFGEALDLARVERPVAPITQEEAIAMGEARAEALRQAPGPSGLGRFNWPGVAVVVFFGVFFLGLYASLLTTGNLVLGTPGLVLFGAVTGYLALTVRRTRRFRCGFCGRMAVFRRTPTAWVCVRCGGSWPRSPAETRAGDAR